MFLLCFLPVSSPTHVCSVSCRYTGFEAGPLTLHHELFENSSFTFSSSPEVCHVQISSKTYQSSKAF